jgi:hypothetical protein
MRTKRRSNVFFIKENRISVGLYYYNDCLIVAIGKIEIGNNIIFPRRFLKQQGKNVLKGIMPPG